ncbi:hypothetical protein [Serratia fonticola]|uniref:hypothetical protein n=1 Tax=Serratia fonticola TaxID=47917 RepID=UPI00192D1CD4|nr:hypothetical protein [Serratia fonticola]MBL5825246.1 hypothetical protein [Serratia fonticola]
MLRPSIPVVFQACRLAAMGSTFPLLCPFYPVPLAIDKKTEPPSFIPDSFDSAITDLDEGFLVALSLCDKSQFNPCTLIKVLPLPGFSMTATCHQTIHSQQISSRLGSETLAV